MRNRFATIAAASMLMFSSLAFAQLHDTSQPQLHSYNVEIQPGNFSMTVSQVDNLPAASSRSKMMEKGPQKIGRPGQITLRWPATAADSKWANVKSSIPAGHVEMSIRSANGGPTYYFNNATLLHFSVGQMDNQSHIKISSMQVSYQDYSVR